MNHSRKKRIMSLLLALFMLTSTAAPAFADLFAFVTVEDDSSVPVYTEGELTASNGGYTVTVQYGADAQIPEGTELCVAEIPEGTLQYDGYRETAEGQVLAEDEQTVFARFFDISLVYADLTTGETVFVEPAADVNVTISSEEVESAEKVSVVHFPEGSSASSDEAEGLVEEAIEAAFGKEALKANKGALKAGLTADLTVEGDAPVADLPTVEDNAPVENGVETPAMEVLETETVGEGVVAFTADGFSVYGIVGTSLIADVTLPGSDDVYEVEVTYGADAKIPDGVHLEVSAYPEGSIEYDTAKEIISEEMDISNLSFAAVDISIVDRFGNKIEPADGATVNVSFSLKALPLDVSEEEFENTFEIHHIKENNGWPEVETINEFNDVVIADGAFSAEFVVDGFSTFTITWGSATNTTTNLRLRARGNNGSNYNNTVGQVTFNYVNSNGYPITRPNNVGGNTDINVPFRTNASYSDQHYEVTISSDNVARAITNRTYERAYITDNGVEKDVDEIRFSRLGQNDWQIDYYYNNSLVTSVHGANVTNNTWMIPVNLQYTGDADMNEVTLHFVDRDGNPLSGFSYGGETLSDTVSKTINELFPANGDTLDLATAFTKDGYTFANSFINYHNGTASDGVVIGNMLRRNNNAVQYKTTPANANNYTTLTDGKDIYLVFDPISSGSGGGSGGGDDDTPDLGEIGNSKAVTSNNDGTYKVTLSVSGSAQHKTEDTDINVVFVVDVSNSMTTSTSGSTRIALTKTAVKNMAAKLLDNNTTANPDAIELALVWFNAQAGTVSFGDSNWTTSSTAFNDAVGSTATNGITCAQGTNWEEGLQNAITVDKGDGDLTFVIFFTDGDPTEYAGHRSVDTNYENNYWPARDEARKLVVDGKVLYGIFAYGGTGTHFLEPLVNYAYNGSSTGYYYNASNAEAVESALADILDTINMQFAYANVEIDDGVTGLSTTNLRGADTSSLEYKITYKDYTSTTEYTTKTITTAENADGYKLTVNSDGTVSIPAITYHVLGKDSSGNTIVEEKTTAAVTIKGAGFTDNGDAGKSLAWDMHKSDNSVYMLEDGWTYFISFNVWPSQAAYDLVAALNNGIITWGQDFVYTDSDDNTVTVYFNDYKNQVNQGTPYTLKTNTSCEVKYQQVTATTDSEGHTTYTYGPVKTVPVVADPEGQMGLASTTMNVQKAWDDSINTRNRANYVDFYLKIDGKYYHKDGTESTEEPSENEAFIIVVTDTGSYVEGGVVKSAGGTPWIDSVYIAPGVMTTEGGIEVLEAGHYYTILEKSAHKYERDDNRNPIVGTADSYQTYSMDFTSQTVRPMVVDGTLEYLVLVDADNPVPSGAKTYTIGSETYYVVTGSTAGLTATNHKTPEFDITKAISDSTGKTEAELNEEIFTYTVTVNVPEGSTDTEKAGVGYWIYEPSNSSSAWTLPEYAAEGAAYAPYGYTSTATYYGDSRQGVSFSGNTATVTIRIHRTEVIRFVNLPVGTTYTIVEAASDYYSVSSATTSTEGSGASGATINGTTSNVNTRYYNQYTNTVTKDFVYGKLDVTKAVEGFDWLEDDKYTFTLTPVGTAPMPMVKGDDGSYAEAASVTVTATYDTDTHGSTVETFGNIRYTAAGSYQYTVTEMEGSLAYIDYADPVTVTVTVEEVDGSLKVTNIADSAGTTVYTAATSSAMANGLTTMTNKVPTISVSATKEWLDSQGNVMTTVPEGANVIFTLYQNGTATEQTVVLDGTVDENGETTAWTATFKDLPQYTVTVNEGVRTATPITYTIGETTPYEGFKLITTEPVAYDGKIQNKQQAIAIDMIKIDASSSNKPLADAEFKLYSDEALRTQISVDANGNTIGTDGTIKTDSEGKADIGTLAIGTYYLVETKAPAGYNMMTSSVTITVSSIETEPYVRVSYIQVGYSASQTTGLITKYDEDGETIIGYTITVDNKSGVELPHTGASHPLAYTIAGLTMLVTVGAVLHHRKKVEEDA